jgi:hypothetical protein
MEQQKEVKKIKLELSIEHVNSILKAIGSLPYVNVYELINTIQMQINAQIAEDPKGKK